MPIKGLAAYSRKPALAHGASASKNTQKSRPHSWVLFTSACFLACLCAFTCIDAPSAETMSGCDLMVFSENFESQMSRYSWREGGQIQLKWRESTNDDSHNNHTSNQGRLPAGLKHLIKPRKRK